MQICIWGQEGPTTSHIRGIFVKQPVGHCLTWRLRKTDPESENILPIQPYLAWVAVSAGWRKGQCASLPGGFSVQCIPVWGVPYLYSTFDFWAEITVLTTWNKEVFYVESVGDTGWNYWQIPNLVGDSCHDGPAGSSASEKIPLRGEWGTQHHPPPLKLGSEAARPWSSFSG